MNLQTCIDDAIVELETDHLADATLDEADAIQECIFEIADSNTPIYYSNIMECADSDYGLLHNRSDLATEEMSPMDAIQLNIFDRIEQALFERLNEWKEEQEEKEQEEEEREEKREEEERFWEGEEDWEEEEREIWKNEEEAGEDPAHRGKGWG